MKRKNEQEKKSRCIELLKELFDLEQTNEKTHKQAKREKHLEKRLENYAQEIKFCCDSLE